MLPLFHVLGERMCEFSVEESLNETRHGLCRKICEFSVEEPLKKGMGLVRGYVIHCERRHAKRHVLGERMKDLSVDKSY